MNRHPLREITDAEVRTFEDEGVVLLRGMFDGDWTEHLGAAIDTNMSAPGPLVLEYANEETGGRYHGDLFLWRHGDAFRDFVFDSPAGEIAGRMMGASKVNFFYDQLLVKEPGTNAPTPWHPDEPYWAVKGWQVCSLWLPIDPITADSGGMQYVRGSHKWTTRYRAQSFTGDDRFKDPDRVPVPPIEDMAAPSDIITFGDMAPGDVLVHHMNVMHGSPGNLSATHRRRALATRWTGDDAIYDPTPYTFQLLEDPGIEPGAPMNCDLFPAVWGQT
jgi:ectoine hydroxylase-related dioxygenase (phytanoyl-CoA dioxygenase family)